MVWEGMLTEGLSVMKAVHERYNGTKRNPYDEVECSSHYARSMASYGVFLAACGFEYHGPKGRLGFSPKISPEDFKSAFVTAEGWGSFTQKVLDDRLSADLEVRYGNLELTEFSLGQLKGSKITDAVVKLDGKSVKSTFSKKADKYLVQFNSGIILRAGQHLNLNFF
jgi:hypothetical protein